MKLNKKIKIIIPIVFIIFLIISVGIIIYIQINNSYVFKIKDALFKTLEASSASFDFEYKFNDEEIYATGNLEYNLQKLTLLGNAESNKGDVVIKVSKGNSDVGYFLEKFNYWITFDVTSIANDVLEVLENLGKESVEEDFPIQTILKLVEIDEKIDISKYPNKLTKSFMIKFITNNFTKNILNYEESSKEGETIYSIKPNAYELLYQFVKTSNVDRKEKNEMLKDLEDNKKELEKIELELSVSVDKNGYLTSLYYYQDDKVDVTSMKIDLKNINKAKVQIEEKVLNKLSE